MSHIKSQTLPPNAETAAMRFRVLMAFDRIVMHKVDGRETPSQPLDKQGLDVAA